MQKTSNLFILNIEFCKSCHTHNWCTHHDQQKYQSTYRKLKHYLQKQFGSDIFVQGNVIPQELVPIKPSQNKYFNSKTSKYVTFPSIGAFQIMLQSELIFSKKKTHTWPNFEQIADLISLKLHGQPRQKSPTKKHNTMKNVTQKIQSVEVDIKTQKDNVSLKNQSFLDHTDKRSTFYKFRPQNQHKNFTLTDHFKNYHNANYKIPLHEQKNGSDEYFTTTNTDHENQFSDISSFQNVNSSEKDFQEFKKNFDMFGLQGRLPEFFKKKGYLKEDLGKKEMIIRLDSIEEESILMDENSPSYGQNVNLSNTHTTFKSKPKDTHKRLMKRFTDDFEELEAKFKSFEQRVENIREENKKFDQRDSTNKLNEKILKEMNELKKKQKQLRTSQIKQNLIDEAEEDQMMIENPIIFARRKLKNIEDYINGTEQQKNQKLKKIYGEWKLLKKPYKGRNYVSPYKMQASKRTDGSKNKQKEEIDHNQFSESLSSSDQEISEQKTRLKIKQPKLPKMPDLKSSKSNQALTQQKFYSTARDKFQELGNRKLNSKMSEKKFESFQNNSAEKKIHRGSTGFKLNTFDHISQVSKEKKQYGNGEELENYQFFQTKKQKTSQKGKIQKYKAKNQGKENEKMLTKKALSRGREMSQSSTKIDDNNRVHRFTRENEDEENSEQGQTNSRQFSQKKMNFRSKKKPNISNSKSRQKYQNNQKNKQLRLKKQNSSQEEAELQNTSLSSQKSISQSHQNSKSFQNNFLCVDAEMQTSQPKKGNISSQVKNGNERSIGDLKEWKSVEVHKRSKDAKQVKSKPGRNLLNKAIQVGSKTRLKKSSSVENQNFDNKSKTQLNPKNSEQQNLFSQSVIRTTQNKLTKKSKAQRQDELLNKKKSSKIIKNNRKNQFSSEEQNQQMVKQMTQNDQEKQKIEKTKIQQMKISTRKNKDATQQSKNDLHIQNNISKKRKKLNKSDIRNDSDEKDLLNEKQTMQKIQNKQNDQQFLTNSNLSQQEETQLQQYELSDKSQDQSEYSHKTKSENIQDTDSLSHKQNVDHKKKITIKKEDIKKISQPSRKDKYQINSENQRPKQHLKFHNQISEDQYSLSKEEEDPQDEKDSFSSFHNNVQKESDNSLKSGTQKTIKQSANTTKKNHQKFDNSHLKKQEKNKNDHNYSSHDHIAKTTNEKRSRQSSRKNQKHNNMVQSHGQTNLSKENSNLEDSKDQAHRDQTLGMNTKISKKAKEKKNRKLVQPQVLQNQEKEVSKDFNDSDDNKQQFVREEQQRDVFSSSKTKRGIQDSSIKRQSHEKLHIQARQESNHEAEKDEEAIQKSSQMRKETNSKQVKKQNQQKFNQFVNQQSASSESSIKGGSNDQKQLPSKFKEKNLKSGQDQSQISESKKKKLKNKKQLPNFLKECSQQLIKKKENKNQQQQQSLSNFDKEEQKSQKSVYRASNNEGNYNQVASQNRKKHYANCQKNDEKQFRDKIDENKSTQNQNIQYFLNLQKHQQNLLNFKEKSLIHQNENNNIDQKSCNKETENEIISKQLSNENELTEAIEQNQPLSHSRNSSQKIENTKTKKEYKLNKQSQLIVASPDSNLYNSEQNRKAFDLIHANGSSKCFKFDEKARKKRQQILAAEQKDGQGQSQDPNSINQKNRKNSEIKQREVFINDKPSQQRPINTSRTNRNKILNIYDTDQQNCDEDVEEQYSENLNDSQDEKDQLIKSTFIKQQKPSSASKQKTQKQTKNQKSEIFSNIVSKYLLNVESQEVNKNSLKNTNELPSTDIGVQIDNISSTKQNQLNQSAQKDFDRKYAEAASCIGIKSQSDQNLIKGVDSSEEKIIKNLENQKENELKVSSLQRQIKQTKVDKSSPHIELSQKRQQNQKLGQSSQQQNSQLKSQQINVTQQQEVGKEKINRAPITKQFYGPSFQKQLQYFPQYFQNQKNFLKKSGIQNDTDLTHQNASLLPKNSILAPLPNYIAFENPKLFNSKSIEVSKIESNHPMMNLIKCLKILTEINDFLIIRLFENPFFKITSQNIQRTVFGVWLCINYEWKCIIVDLNKVLLEQKTGKLFFLSHQSHQLWPIVLEKALAKALGGYEKLLSLPCHKIFNILTGSNSLFFNIKEDPSKNGRILRYINDCENKNFILHAEKVCRNLEELQCKEKEAKIFYVISQRTVNQNDILLEIRDSSKQESQWMKLAKFVQEFRSIEILQLRINHNFNSISLPKPTSTQNLTIVSLQFSKESFGSITLSTESHPTNLLRTFLYREEKSNYLKLVGQAQQKNKTTLFFDCCFGEGKYWLFVECVCEGRVTYLGENQPFLHIVEQVQTDGLRNDWTEYLPVKTGGQTGIRVNKQNFEYSTGFKGSIQGFRMPNKLTKNKFGDTGMSFKSHDDKIEKLRQTFVEFLLKGKDSSLINK